MNDDGNDTQINVCTLNVLLLLVVQLTLVIVAIE